MTVSDSDKLARCIEFIMKSMFFKILKNWNTMQKEKSKVSCLSKMVTLASQVRFTVFILDVLVRCPQLCFLYPPKIDYKSIKNDPWSIQGSPEGCRRTDSEDLGSQGGGQLSKKSMNIKTTRCKILIRRWAVGPAILFSLFRPCFSQQL